MRLRGVVLFAVAALVTGIDANLSVKSKETVASALSDQFNLLPLGGDHAPARRFLRATDADEDEEEEERVGPSASIVDKFKGLISSKSATESLEQWVTKGKPVNKVFSSLSLGKVGDTLFFNAFQLIEVAKKVTSTETLALRLQGEQLQYWAALGKSPDEVFNLFTLGAAGERLFSKPEFAAWVKYVDDFNVKNPTKTTSTIPTLLYHHTDGTLAELIALAKKSDATNSIATKVGNAQMNAWLSSGKSADDVFMLLKLYKAEDDFFKTRCTTRGLRT
uniref:RxLR effector protein n=1 Tax=Phytophthora sojae TaxID=67593 RepID=G1FRU5_PHYSO|nr:Avh175.2 [Phytophthora sojae]